ncbi:MAG: hypothetical protein SFV55_12850 [Haliscomenobacter sp.]|uniref:hypothetical protein n=1 Tax=Haliscomenobacter sp. TaxID=2717303 RepID=UPI0029B3BE51|nr:hypothetical protein [Haliscomenobacter sp.]MDX2069306.1 hypothetical protein [Haliscomenobacter sp.]
MRNFQILLLCSFFSTTVLIGQADSVFVGHNVGHNDFTNCTAVLLNDKMVVNEYTPTGKCELALDAKGIFTVQPVSLQDNNVVIPQGKRRFKIAIKDANTKTMTSFSDQTYTEIEVGKVLSQCRKGDYIVFITMDRELALPHNEVLVK